MADVRLDQNHQPKGPAFDWTVPVTHRTAITAIEADPADDTDAVDCDGYQRCRFDVTLAGVSITSVEVQVLYWNSRQSLWFGGARRVFTAAGQYALEVEARGAKLFLKVLAKTATSFQIDADYALS